MKREETRKQRKRRVQERGSEFSPGKCLPGSGPILGVIMMSLVESSLFPALKVNGSDHPAPAPGEAMDQEGSCRSLAPLGQRARPAAAA